jgi:hypothetical protein
VTIAAIGLSLVVVVALAIRHWAVALGVGVFTLLCFARPVTPQSTPWLLSGVADGEPRITSFLVVAGGFALASLAFSGRARMPLVLKLFVAVLLLGMATWWSGSSSEWAGVLQYCLAPLGWSAGSFAALVVRRVPNGTGALLAGVVSALGVQVVVVMLQLAGFSINAVSREEVGDTLIGARVNGLTGHANTLGKIAFLSILLVLPLAVSASARVRRWSFVAIAAAFSLLAVTGGRANFLGAISLMAVWLLLTWSGGGRVRSYVRKYGYVGAVGALAVVVVLGTRFTEDPSGGSRPYLTESALRVIPSYLFGGMGPNQYLTVMIPGDAVSARTMLPVHNTFLLVLAELGIVAAALLLTPLVLVTVRALRLRARSKPAVNPWSTVAIAAVAPFLVIAGTGWGMAADGILPLWFMTVGFLNQGMQLSQDAERSRAGVSRVVPGQLDAPVPDLPGAAEGRR